MADLLWMIGRGVLPPALAFTLILGPLWIPKQGLLDPASARTQTLRALAAPLSFGLGLLGALLALRGGLPRMPFEANFDDRVVYLLLLATFFGILQAKRRPRWFLAELSLVLVAPLYALEFMREHHWESKEALLWLGGLSVGLGGSWLASAGLAKRSRGAFLPGAWLLSGVLLSGTLYFGGSVAYAQWAGAWSTCIGAALVLGWLRPGFSITAAGAAPLSLAYALMIMGGCFVSELPWQSAGLALLAPLTPWLAELPMGKLGVRRALGLLAGLLLAAAALALAWQGHDADPYAAYY